MSGPERSDKQKTVNAILETSLTLLPNYCPLKAPDFSTIESALGLTLPEHFTSFYSNEQDLIEELMELWNGELNLYLAMDADWMISKNLEIRNPENCQVHIPGSITIGHDGVGNLGVIREDPNDHRVWIIDYQIVSEAQNPETLEIDWNDDENLEVYPDLKTYISEQIEMINELEEDEEY